MPAGGRLFHRSLTAVCLVIAIALTVMAADLGVMLANRHEDNRVTFYAFTGSWSDYLALRQEWRPRILSNYLGSQLALRVEPYATSDAGRMSIVAAAWTGGWFLATCLVLVAFSGRQALFYLFGLFAGIAFGYLPTVNSRIYPWDLPALFIFAVFLVCFDRDVLWPLFVLLPVGMLFKETTIVLCLVFLLRTGGPKHRILEFGIAICGCYLVKAAIDALVGVELPGNSMTIGDADGSNLMLNLRSLASLNRRYFVNPVLINAGTLLPLWLLPHRDRRVPVLKLIALVFAVNMMVFGRIVEYRIWFELIPLSLYALHLTYLAAPPPDPVAATSCPS